MFYRAFLLVPAVLVCISSGVRANPIATEVLRARQVPETTHVQITFAWDKNHSRIGDAGATALGDLTRNGAKLAPEWIETKGGFTTNSGSGLVSMNAAQTCDCSVPLGDHHYELSLKGQGYPLSVTIGVSSPGTKDGGTASDGPVRDASPEHPWEIPDPEEIQGLDCTKACANTADGGAHDASAGTMDGDARDASTGSDAPLVPSNPDGSADAPAANPDAGNPAEKSDDGGWCALGGRSTREWCALPALLLAALALTRRRSRRE